MEQRVKDAEAALLTAVAESAAARQYRESAELLKERPGVLEKILALRSETIDIYAGDQEEELLSGTERIAEAYEELQRIPEVNRFLESEEALVSMLKEIRAALFDAVNLYLPE